MAWSKVVMGRGSELRLQGIECGSQRAGACFGTVGKCTGSVGAVLARYLLKGELAKEQIN